MVELYEFLTGRYNVTKAKEFIRKRPRKIRWLSIVGLPVGLHRIDEDRLVTIGPHEPCIITDLNWPIDGWHRIAVASSLNLESIACYRLTKRETAACML